MAASNPSRTADKSQIDRAPADGFGLGLIPGGRPVIRPPAPIVWPLGKPDEIRLGNQGFQHPPRIVPIVRGQTQFGLIGHYTRQLIQGLGPDKAALVVARLGPGIGKENKGPVYGRRRQCLKQIPGIALEDADRIQALIIHPAQELGDTIDEKLSPEQAYMWMRARLPGEVFAGAKADFQPDVSPVAVNFLAGGW